MNDKECSKGVMPKLMVQLTYFCIIVKLSYLMHTLQLQCHSQ